jgi:hypothetical protein
MSIEELDEEQKRAARRGKNWAALAAQQAELDKQAQVGKLESHSVTRKSGDSALENIGQRMLAWLLGKPEF